MTFEDIKKAISKKVGERDLTKTLLTKSEDNLLDLRKKTKQHERALELVKLAALKTQEQIQFHISDITSLALSAVFPEPYKLVLEFVERRNKTECDLYFSRNEERLNPLDSSGGGPVDIASFALRIASWSLKQPNGNNTIILDEPFKNLSKEYREQGSMLLQEVSQKLGIQFIIVTHMPILTQYADKVFTVENKNKISKITTQ
jgi:DNA repair ATPase RecN